MQHDAFDNASLARKSQITTQHLATTTDCHGGRTTTHNSIAASPSWNEFSFLEWFFIPGIDAQWRLVRCLGNNLHLKKYRSTVGVEPVAKAPTQSLRQPVKHAIHREGCHGGRVATSANMMSKMRRANPIVGQKR